MKTSFSVFKREGDKWSIKLSNSNHTHVKLYCNNDACLAVVMNKYLANGWVILEIERV